MSNTQTFLLMNEDFNCIRSTILAFPQYVDIVQTTILDITKNHITVELINERGWVGVLGVTLNSDRSVATSIGITFSSVENFQSLFWTINWLHWATSKKDIVFC